MTENNYDQYNNDQHDNKQGSNEQDFNKQDLNKRDSNKKDNKESPLSSTKATETATLKMALSDVLENAYYPDATTVVTGALNAEKVAAAAKAGIEHIINFQPIDELDFDEQAEVEKQGITYTHLPIASAEDLKQVNILTLDKALRENHGKKTLMHCKSGNRVGACMALRAGWLRARKMDTALERGRLYGLTGLEEEVRNRLLVPR